MRTKPVKPEPPKCGTCPYWDGDSIASGSHMGECRRLPPVFVTLDSMVELEGSDAWLGQQPCTASRQWCGEHPDFPSYMEALKASTKSL